MRWPVSGLVNDRERVWGLRHGKKKISGKDVRVDESRSSVGMMITILPPTERLRRLLVANEWRGMENIAAVAQEKKGRVFSVEAPAMHAGWP